MQIIIRIRQLFQSLQLGYYLIYFRYYAYRPDYRCITVRLLPRRSVFRSYLTATMRTMRPSYRRSQRHHYISCLVNPYAFHLRQCLERHRPSRHI